MIKEISTYGALLLTTMVVIRATTMEKESEADIRSLYERRADNAYINHNLDFRDSYNTYNATSQHLLAFTSKTETVLQPNTHEVVHAIASEYFYENDLVSDTEIAELEIENEFTNRTETDLTELENGLSLDRESTINTGLSLLFPRQRIKPKPAPSPLQE